jgi:hypothetical protein
VTDGITCPTWCTTNHDLTVTTVHKGPDLGSRWGALPVRIVQATDTSDPRIVVAGEFLDEAAAHELGLALVRAADTLRRVRQAAEQAVTA